MSYYHTARAHARALKTFGEDNKRKAERRAEVANVQAEQPVNLLRVDGRPVKRVRSDEQYRAVENMEGMIPWNGHIDNLIDRFDGRALLDFYREPPPPSARRPKRDEEVELDELVAFEGFRDLVTLLQTGCSEREGLETAIQNNIELRATAMASAAAAAGIARPQPGGAPSQYGAVGFSYGGPADSASDSDYESTSSEDERDDNEKQADGAVDDLAANVGIDNFSIMLRRAEKQEEAEALGQAPRKKRPFSRKKAAERAKRMAGQGLEPFAKDKSSRKPETGSGRDRDDFRPGYGRRSSPEYLAYRSYSQSSSRSRSRSPPARRSHREGAGGRTEYITEFKVGKEHRHSARAAPDALRRPQPDQFGPDNDSQSSHKRGESFLDALPSRADPAVNGGPVSLPVAGTTMQGIRAMDYRDRGTDSYRDRDRRSEREIQAERARSGSRPAAPAAAKAAVPVRETPMERLKRLRAAQLNKTFQNEVLTHAQRKATEERDRAARLQIERAARQYSPPRRSPSPPPRRRRSRSRSRSRSPSYEKHDDYHYDSRQRL